MLDFGFYNMDCMKALKDFPDGYFDLSIVDPPYGGGTDADAANVFEGGISGRFGQRFERYLSKDKRGHCGGGHMKDYGYGHWDIAPDEEYFKELFRVSKNQIIWGGNYFALPPTRCFLIWEKTNIPEKFTMSMCEYAWTSFCENAKIFKYSSMRTAESGKFHPTEKPIALYTWILNNYAKKGDKILDTHVGSASSLIACHRLGFDYMGFEISEEYYKKAQKRLEDEKRQISIFELLETT